MKSENADLKARPVEVAVEKVRDEQAIADAVNAARKEEQTAAGKRLAAERQTLEAQITRLEQERKSLEQMQQNANNERIKAEEERDAAFLPEFGEIDRYVVRQCRKGLIHSPHNGLRLYYDYHTMLLETLDVAPTHDEIWPRNLLTAHDRLTEVQKEQIAIAGFEKILTRWGGLEWSDGTFCARLPRSSADLIAEGHSLHHCVGGYGKNHVAGKIIIFIRRARRPERSYYTLNENLTGNFPHRIQLHGYRNENLPDGRHLTIPNDVLEFVEKWEKEILNPIFARVRGA